MSPSQKLSNSINSLVIEYIKLVSERYNIPCVELKNMWTGDEEKTISNDDSDLMRRKD